MSQNMMGMYKVVLDSNFLIIGFRSNPSEFDKFCKICREHGFEIFTTLNVFQELDWTIKKEVINKIKVLNIPKVKIEEFIRLNRSKLNLLPQKPDISLIILANNIEDCTVVTSDFKLLQTLKKFAPNCEGLMGSAFILKLMETEENPEYKAFLGKIRERVYDEEIRYSIKRSELFDPVTRIKLIEDHTISVIRKLKLTSDISVTVKNKEIIALLNSIEEARAIYPLYLESIRRKELVPMLKKLNDIWKQFYNFLMLIRWQMSSDEHRSVIKSIGSDIVIINYLIALGYLYLGNEKALKEASKRLDIANGVLLLLPLPENEFRELMITVHLLRIIILLLLDKYEDSVFYFSLFERKCEEWGFLEELESIRGIYFALINLKGEQVVTDIPDTKHIKEIIVFLLDFAHQLFVLTKLDKAWRILNQAYVLSKITNKKKMITDVLIKMSDIAFAIGTIEVKTEYVKILKESKTLFKKNNWDTQVIQSLIVEIEGDAESKYLYKSAEELLNWSKRTWLTILKIIKKEKAVTLICRAHFPFFNIGIQFKKEYFLNPVNLGDKLKLISGNIELKKMDKDLCKQYHVCQKVVVKDNNFNIIMAGTSGFRYFKLIRSTEMSLSKLGKIKLKTKELGGLIKGKFKIKK
ncbi:MAG: PIN domain-containing protein [Candidatus Odinarchaeia archaeon]